MYMVIVYVALEYEAEGVGRKWWITIKKRRVREKGKITVLVPVPWRYARSLARV